MTGFGEATAENERSRVRVEARSVNNRFLKVQCKLPERLLALEPQVQRLVKEAVARGTVTLAVRVQRAGVRQRHRIDTAVLEDYVAQLSWLLQDHPHAAAGLLKLPGVMGDADEQEDDPGAGDLVLDCVRRALFDMQAMRTAEGAAAEKTLREGLDRIAGLVGDIGARCEPAVVAHRDRLAKRVEKLLAGHDVTVGPADLLREVSILAERTDVAEELARLDSHLEQFRTLIGGAESPGRKLDFLCQELYREANTTATKSTDQDVGRAAVDLKGEVEQLRELVQNIE